MKVSKLTTQYVPTCDKRTQRSYPIGKSAALFYWLLVLFFASIALPVQAHTQTDQMRRHFAAFAADTDSDGDWVPDERELEHGSDPFLVDSDVDGMTDFEEIYIFKTDPATSDQDTDGDGFVDEVEKDLFKTDPQKVDVDQDGDLLPDSLEIAAGTDPIQVDTDNDLLSDFLELFLLQSDPLVADADVNGNGYPDLIEQWLPTSLLQGNCSAEITFSVDGVTVIDPEEADSPTNIGGGDETLFAYALVITPPGGARGLRASDAEIWKGDLYEGDVITGLRPIGPFEVLCGDTITLIMEANEQDLFMGTSMGVFQRDDALLFRRIPIGWEYSTPNIYVFKGTGIDGTFEYEAAYATAIVFGDVPLAPVKNNEVFVSDPEQIDSVSTAIPSVTPVKEASVVESTFKLSGDIDSELLEAIRSNKPTFMHDFKTYDGRWITDSDQAITTQLLPGRYEVMINIGKYFVSQPIAVEVADFLLQVNTTQITNSQNGKTDIRFRVIDTQNFYQFDFGAEGYYQLLRTVNGDVETLIKTTQSAHINKGGNAQNRVEIYANGPQIVLAMNGHILAEVNDVALSHGDIAIGASTFEQGGMQVAFTSLQLWNLVELENSLLINRTNLDDFTTEELVDLGNMHLKYERLDDALTLFNRTLERENNSVGALIGRANAYRILEDFDQAKIDIERALNIDKDYAPAWLAQGVVYQMQGDFIKAHQSLKETLKRNPQYSQAYVLLGRVYLGEKQFEQALSAMNQAIRLAPQDPSGYVARGDYYFEQEDLLATLNDYSQAIKLDPEYFYAYTNRGMAYQQQGEYTKALQDYNIAIALNSTSPFAYWTRGYLLASAFEEYEGALKSLDQAIDLAPNWPKAYLFRAFVWEKRREYSKALSDIEKALDLDPTMAEAYYTRAETYMNLREISSAYNDYERYLELDQTQSRFARRACQQMNDLYPLVEAADKGIFGLIFGAVAQPCSRFPDEQFHSQRSQSVSCRTSKIRDYVGGPVYPYCECSDGTGYVGYCR